MTLPSATSPPRNVKLDQNSIESPKNVLFFDSRGCNRHVTKFNIIQFHEKHIPYICCWWNKMKKESLARMIYVNCGSFHTSDAPSFTFRIHCECLRMGPHCGPKAFNVEFSLPWCDWNPKLLAVISWDGLNCTLDQSLKIKVIEYPLLIRSGKALSLRIWGKCFQQSARWTEPLQVFKGGELVFFSYFCYDDPGIRRCNDHNWTTHLLSSLK